MAVLFLAACFSCSRFWHLCLSHVFGTFLILRLKRVFGAVLGCLSFEDLQALSHWAAQTLRRHVCVISQDL